MKIAQVAPLFERVPPQAYGGTERVVSYLTEALVDLGHEVTLFASGDSRTRARLMPVDVMHFHVDFPHYPLVRHCPTPCLSTLHGRPDLPGLAPLHHHRACRAAFERRFTAHRMAQHCLEVSAALSGASSGAGDSDTSEPDAALGSTGTGK